jgi:hypothetical protein
MGKNFVATVLVIALRENWQAREFFDIAKADSELLFSITSFSREATTWG